MRTAFTFITKTPPAAELIKKAAGVPKGSGVPHREKVGKISRDQVRDIATTKLPDLNANDVESAMKIVEVPPAVWASPSLSNRDKSMRERLARL